MVEARQRLELEVAAQVEAQAKARAIAEAEAAELLKARLALEKQAEEEAESFLLERRRQLEAVEADTAEKTLAIETLKTEAAAEVEKSDAAVTKATGLQQQWDQVERGIVEGQHITFGELTRQFTAAEEQEHTLRKTVEELERDLDNLPEVERQRLWWLERVTRLEFEIQEYERRLEPLDRECEALEQQRQVDARRTKDLRRRTGALAAAFDTVGVDINSLRDADGTLDAMDLSLSICLAVMPPRGPDFAVGREAKAYAGAGPRLDDMGDAIGPPLLPSRLPQSRASSPSPRLPSPGLSPARSAASSAAAPPGSPLQAPAQTPSLLRRVPPLLSGMVPPVPLGAIGPMTRSPLLPGPVLAGGACSSVASPASTALT